MSIKEIKEHCKILKINSESLDSLASGNKKKLMGYEMVSRELIGELTDYLMNENKESKEDTGNDSVKEDTDNDSDEEEL